MTKKIYLENPYLTEIETDIISSQFIDDKYYIKTEKTIFHPDNKIHQPGDTGTINGINVLGVFEKNNDIIHILDKNLASKKVSLKIDWNKRLDYMQQHSGQHLLSGVLYRLLGIETININLKDEINYIDLNIKDLSIENIIKIEDFANRMIYSNFPIKTYSIEKNNKNNHSKIRIIEIDNLDFSPCLGTHLRNTGEIGILKIINIYSINDFLRLEFLCGMRALKNYQDIQNKKR